MYIHHEEAKETLQLYLNKQALERGERYIGAIQYEEINDYAKREPHIVIWRFKRSNLPSALKQKLEQITPFRKDKNQETVFNPNAESISFKFEYLDEEAKETMRMITRVLLKHSGRKADT